MNRFYTGMWSRADLGKTNIDPIGRATAAAAAAEGVWTEVGGREAELAAALVAADDGAAQRERLPLGLRQQHKRTPDASVVSTVHAIQHLPYAYGQKLRDFTVPYSSRS